VLKRESLPLNTIVGTLNIKAAMFKVTRDQVTHVTVVLNQQNAGFHSKIRENRNGKQISQLSGIHGHCYRQGKPMAVRLATVQALAAILRPGRRVLEPPLGC
jgi:hypothetical protein